jgi:hypothetical protein
VGATLALLVASSPAVAADVVGKWKTVDDKTGQARSEVEVDQEDGKVYKAEVWAKGN